MKYAVTKWHMWLSKYAMNEPFNDKFSMYSPEIEWKRSSRKKTHTKEDDFGAACNFLLQFF